MHIKDKDLRNLYKSFSLNRLSKISKTQIGKFSKTSSVTRKDKYFTNLIKDKKSENFVIRRERSIVAAMINNLRLLKSNDEAFARVYLSNPELESLRNMIIDIIATENILKAEDLKKTLLKKCCKLRENIFSSLKIWCEKNCFLISQFF